MAYTWVRYQPVWYSTAYYPTWGQVSVASLTGMVPSENVSERGSQVMSVSRLWNRSYSCSLPRFHQPVVRHGGPCYAAYVGPGTLRIRVKVACERREPYLSDATEYEDGKGTRGITGRSAVKVPIVPRVCYLDVGSTYPPGVTAR
jgi:hypothetical protein